MSLRIELLDWLAGLPAMETAEDRRALLELAQSSSASISLDWEGSRYAFAGRLLDELSWEGRAAVVAFLGALRSLPWLHDDAERRQQLEALQSRLEALNDDEFVAAFLMPGADQIAETAAEPPDEGLSWELPFTTEAEPPEDRPRAKPPRGTAGTETPAPEPATPAPSPRRPFESLEDAAPGGVDVDQDVETVESGGTVTGAVIGGSGPTSVGGQHYHAGTINIYHGTPDTGLLARPSTPSSSLIEEAIRLDVAAPPAATLELPFDLAVAVRQPDAPTLAIEDLTQVKSQDGTVFRREEEEIVLYRVAVAAAGCEVYPPHYILKLRPRANSAPCWFQITPHRPGKQSIVVTAYQQDDALAAQTRLSIEVQVPVAPGT